MGEVLAKTFEGKHIWIKNKTKGKKATKIDAMFFPATGESIDTSNLKAEK